MNPAMKAPSASSSGASAKTHRLSDRSLWVVAVAEIRGMRDSV